MNLFGWDTVSAISLDLANLGLAAAGAGLPTAFEHRAGGLALSGSFGRWQIVPGGALRKLHLEIEIASGSVEENKGRYRRQSWPLAGSRLMVEVPLDLVPSPDGVKPAELRFRSTPGGAQDLVLPLGFRPGTDKLGPVRADEIQNALCDCLSQNLVGIGHVFARIDPGTSPEPGWAATPHLDWAWLETADNRCYLAIFGSLGKPSAAMAPEKVDPEVLAGAGAAFVALSGRMYAQRLLFPWMQQHFKPKATFRCVGTVVENAAPIRLPNTNSPVGVLKPVLTRLRLAQSGTGLAIDTVTETPLGLGSLFVRAQLHIRSSLGADGRIRMIADKTPQVHHEVRGAGILSGLVQLVVEIVLALSGTSVQTIATGIAGAMQGMNLPAAVPASWPGVRKFQATEFGADGCLWFRDSRPLCPETAPLQLPADVT